MKQDASNRILIIEDDPVTVELLRSILENARFQVSVAYDGEAGLHLAQEIQFGLILLDVDLPGLDGLSCCRELQKVSEAPILFLSSKGDELDKIIGLEVGADDYMAKPFHHRELLARVRAVLRRSQKFSRAKAAEESPAGSPQPVSSRPAEVLRCGDLQVDEAAREVYIHGKAVHLTATEFSLLVTFLHRPGRVLTRQILLDLVWGQDWIGDDRTVDVHLRRLRKKLIDDAGYDYFPAVRGIGYKFVPPAP